MQNLLPQSGINNQTNSTANGGDANNYNQPNTVEAGNNDNKYNQTLPGTNLRLPTTVNPGVK
jgi:hypothetical protein